MRLAYHTIILSVCLLFMAESQAQTDVDFSLALPQIEKNIDSLLNDYDEQEPGISIGIVSKNNMVYEKQFGLANLDYEIPITYETSFHVASVSKQFTAFAILLLEDEGKLSLDDDIRIYLPEMHNFQEPITIRHLLNHTSGLKDQFNLLRLSGWTLDDVITNGQVLHILFNQETLNFQPDEKHMYSNSGYTLLAEIVARVSKMSFAEFTNKHIFKSLEMHQSQFVDTEGQIVKNKSISYYKTDSIYREDLFNNFSVGATNLNTTIADLSKWANNFNTKIVGNDSIFKKMHAQTPLNDGSFYGYAGGQFINTYKGFKRIEHSGQDASYQAYLARFPELGLTIIFTNTNGEINGARLVYDIMDICLKPYLGNKKTTSAPKQLFTHKKPIQKETSYLKRFEGYYWDEGDKYSRQIKVENDTLKFITQNGKTALVPVDEQEFEMDIEEYVALTFNADQMIMTLDDGYQIVSDKYIPANYNSKTLEEFNGKYYSPELNAYYTFRTEENTLVANHTRLGDFKLNAIKNDYFLGNKGSFLKVEFLRNKPKDVIGFEVSSSRAKNVQFNKLNN
ncbi:serine hydrolase domain-containing protein [uncultured Draconibacterium sp.]|uniref:serine hydrolase domain-containing protein n=1 Tax=uncultured Draconibacterium sp. TaxID=1573823 RepID=UPI002AA8DF8E|nr:serine hydrolase domain-containing protein [uncultured Draconibacterium sp.]